MRFAPFALALLCALTLFTGLDRVGYLDAREARDACVRRELIHNKEFLTPLYANDPLLEKPIFAYLPDMIAGGRWRRSVPEPPPWRSRAIRAIAAVALVLVTASAAARNFGRVAGAWSALVLASTLGLPLAARMDGAQVWGALFSWIGCAALADAALDRRGSNRRLVGAYLALAAALLVAGPLAALWPIGGIALFAALARDRAPLRRIHPLAGFALLAGAALPWYGAMLDLNGPGFLVHALGFPYGAEHGGAWFLGPLFALSFLVIGFHPWSALAPEAMLHAATWWRFAPRREAPGPGAEPDTLARERDEESAAHVLIAALVAALIPIALHSGVPLTAVLPALPAVAMLCGRLIAHAFEDPERLARPVARAARMMALVGSSAALLLAMVAPRVPEAAADLRLLAAIAFLTSWLPLLATWRNRTRIAIALMTLPVLLGMPVATTYLMPDMEGYLSARTVADVMERQAPIYAPLAILDEAPPSLRYYGHINLERVTSRAAALRDLRAKDGLAYVAFPPAREHEFARGVAVPLEILRRTPSLVLARVDPERPLTEAPQGQ